MPLEDALVLTVTELRSFSLNFTGISESRWTKRWLPGLGLPGQLLCAVWHLASSFPVEWGETFLQGWLGLFMDYLRTRKEQFKELANPKVCFQPFALLQTVTLGSPLSWLPKDHDFQRNQAFWYHWQIFCSHWHTSGHFNPYPCETKGKIV